MGFNKHLILTSHGAILFLYLGPASRISEIVKEELRGLEGSKGVGCVKDDCDASQKTALSKFLRGF